jgi:hypothetical protein
MEPEKIKINVITLGYCLSDMWEKCLDRLLETKSPETEWNHYFVWQHFPTDIDANTKRMQEIAERNGLIWVSPGKNLGGCEGWNWAWRKHLYNSDFILNIDCDSYPVEPNWDIALWKVINNPIVGWAGVKNNVGSDNELAARPHTDVEIDGYRVHLCPTPMMMAGTNMVRTDWIKAIGGIKQDNKYYGGVELNTWPYFEKSGYKLALLADFNDDTRLQSSADPLYIEWKRQHAFYGYQGDFAQYLKEKGKA